MQLASPEVKFEIDTETHDPLDVGMYQVGPSNLLNRLFELSIDFLNSQ